MLGQSVCDPLRWGSGQYFTMRAGRFHAYRSVAARLRKSLTAAALWADFALLYASADMRRWANGYICRGKIRTDTGGVTDAGRIKCQVVAPSLTSQIWTRCSLVNRKIMMASRVPIRVASRQRIHPHCR